VDGEQTAFAVVTKAARPTGIGSGIGCSIGDTIRYQTKTDTTGIGPIPIPSTGISLSLVVNSVDVTLQPATN